MKNSKTSVKSVIIAVAAMAIAVIAVVIIIGSRSDTNQNIQPETRGQQTESGTNSGDGSIDNTTPNSGQSQVQDSEGSTVPQ